MSHLKYKINYHTYLIGVNNTQRILKLFNATRSIHVIWPVLCCNSENIITKLVHIIPAGQCASPVFTGHFQM